MNQMPLVSAIIPCFNNAEFLPDAVASIRRQNYPAVEIILIDDGSTDGSAEVASRLHGPDLHYVHQANRGLPGARNAGLEHARGEIITFLDADDFWNDINLELQVAMLLSHPEMDIVVGYSQKIRVTGYEQERPVIAPLSDAAPALSMNCAVMWRGVFDKVGIFDQGQRYCDDWDWYMRARELGVGIRIHEAVVHYYRRHEANMTNNVDIGNQYTLLMLKKSLDRRRRQQDGQAGSLASLLKKND